MSKLSPLLSQLSDQDFESISESLIKESALKTAELLSILKEGKISELEIQEALNLKKSAYYTLRSRLNEKINEYLLKQMNTPSIELARRVALIQDWVFTKNRNITIESLKTLELELINYDMAPELLAVYKNLKKLNILKPDYYEYSRKYNHLKSYMLDVDKVEELLTAYFTKFGFYNIQNNNTEIEEFLALSNKEIQSTALKYENSHHLKVYCIPSTNPISTFIILG